MDIDEVNHENLFKSGPVSHIINIDKTLEELTYRISQLNGTPYPIKKNKDGDIFPYRVYLQDTEFQTSCQVKKDWWKSLFYFAHHKVTIPVFILLELIFKVMNLTICSEGIISNHIST